jgi:hypothetical protein
MLDRWKRPDYKRHAALRATALLEITNRKATRLNPSHTPKQNPSSE